MKTITIHCHSKNSGGHYSETINIEGKSKDNIKEISDEIFKSAKKSLGRYYYEVECFDDLTADEESILDELELTPDI
jgi:hypothetical protein